MPLAWVGIGLVVILRYSTCFSHLVVRESSLILQLQNTASKEGLISISGSSVPFLLVRECHPVWSDAARCTLVSQQEGLDQFRFLAMLDVNSRGRYVSNCFFHCSIIHASKRISLAFCSNHFSSFSFQKGHSFIVGFLLP